jgi:Family of unknown function (DUF6519)
MKGDFTRSTFDPRKHYRGVRMQQGRVQLDADWNENLDILLHRIETEAIDVIGTCGVPVHDAGFGVVTDFNALTNEEKDWLNKQGVKNLDNGDFLLTQGRAYVDGILVVNDNTVPFTRQPFILPPGSGALKKAGIYQLYLDVWERHLTALEDPAIREVALGGPDTATRTQVVWQAVLKQVGEPGKALFCADKLTPWPEPSTGKLSARTHPEEEPDTPCTVPPGAGYRRLENQLYRVEIHKASNMTGGPTFKWSRENGSVVVAVSEFAVDGSANKIRTSSLGRDDVLGLHELDWVEILDDATELSGEPGQLVQISKIEPDNILTLSQPVTGFDIKLHAKVRRWDSPGEIKVSVPNDNDGYLKLEGGVEIKFKKANATFRSGDYWLIPARTIPGQHGDIEWPQEGNTPAVLPPFGIMHHYCRLAVLTVSEINSVLTIKVEDCRKKFPPLTELPTGGDHCCCVTVGENGDFADLQEAIEARPQGADWWTVCILPGLLPVRDTVTVAGANGLTIRGCGEQCRILGPQDKPVLAFSNGRHIKLQGLYIKGKAGPVVVIDDCREVEIRDNTLVGLPAVQVNGWHIDILSNRIMGGGIQVIPPSRVVNIEGNIISEGGGAGIQLGGGQKTAADYVNMYYAYYQPTPSPKAANETKKVVTPGIETGQSAPAAIQQVSIQRNIIADMEGSGIITETRLLEGTGLGDVEFLSIRENQIIGCVEVPDVDLGNGARVGGGIAVIGIISTQITDNFISLNGNRKTAACGIFVLDGSAIDISDNVVAENGISKGDVEPKQYQAGIAAHHVYGNLDGGMFGPLSGYPALRICNNEVFCPAGQALSVVAMGGVVVEGNTLVTRERLKQPSEPLHFGEKGACVFLIDLGLPLWFQDFAALAALLKSGQASFRTENVNEMEAVAAKFPDGRVMFHNNQVTFSSEDEEQVDSQNIWKQLYLSALFLSFDDLSLSGNQFQASVPPYILTGYKLLTEKKIKVDDWLAYWLKFVDVASLATVVRANANGFSEHLYSNAFSYFSNGTLMNVTTSNEATHAIWGSASNPQKNSYDNNQSLTP